GDRRRHVPRRGPDVRDRLPGGGQALVAAADDHDPAVTRAARRGDKCCWPLARPVGWPPRPTRALARDAGRGGRLPRTSGRVAPEGATRSTTRVLHDEHARCPTARPRPRPVSKTSSPPTPRSDASTARRASCAIAGT